MDNRILVIAALFILLIVLCYSYVSRELFTAHNLEVTRQAIQQTNHDQMDPEGYNGLDYYKNAVNNTNNSGLPPQ